MISDPLALFDAAADALRRQDWQLVASLCDPASLLSFKRQLLEQFEPARPARELAVEQYLRASPDTPREVAEYQVAQLNKRSDPTQRLQEEIPGVRSVAELRALSPVDTFAAWAGSPSRVLQPGMAGIPTISDSAHPREL